MQNITYVIEGSINCFDFDFKQGRFISCRLKEKESASLDLANTRL